MSPLGTVDPRRSRSPVREDARGTSLARGPLMRRAIALVVLAGCDVGHQTTELRAEPEQLDLVVELGATRPEPLYVTAQGLDVTDAATFSLAGAPLGQVDARGFQSDG